MVLLVMFVVYRMRKKDEGSYPLDEQKYQNYSYTKAPDKEFYA
jgi:syndecan 2